MARATRQTTASTEAPLATDHPAALARRGHPILPPPPLPVTTEPSSNGAPKPKRHRGSRGGPGRKRPGIPQEEPEPQVEQQETAAEQEPEEDAESHTKRQRFSRGGRRHRR